MCLHVLVTQMARLKRFVCLQSSSTWFIFVKQFVRISQKLLLKTRFEYLWTSLRIRKLKYRVSLYVKIFRQNLTLTRFSSDRREYPSGHFFISALCHFFLNLKLPVLCSRGWKFGQRIMQKLLFGFLGVFLLRERILTRLTCQTLKFAFSLIKTKFKVEI